MHSKADGKLTTFIEMNTIRTVFRCIPMHKEITDKYKKEK